MLRFVAILVVGVCATSARAADKLEFGPPPAWVKLGPAVKPGPLPASGPAVRVLRYDEQLRFSAAGRSAYTHYVTQVRSSLGLGGLGTVALRWDPAHDTATVHTLRIVRDGQPIDILAKQSFTTIRREENLEQIVDGQLTATLQPEDLRVGDVLDVAYTLTHDEPAMKGHADFAFDLTGMRGIDSLGVRASWPSALPIAWRTGSALEKPVISHHGGETELVIETRDLPELEVPYDAPRRFWPMRDVELSSFKSWAEVAATVAPAFDKAAELAPGSPLKAEAAKIAAATKDPKERAAMALKLVQGQVRYLGLVLSDGGYTPVDADKTWARRFGECKAKATLLTALLREFGIKAEPALVNAYGDPLMDQRLPRMTAFNHVIVRAEIDGKVYWLDGTRPGDTSLNALEVPRHDWALPIRTEGAELIALVRRPRDKPDQEVTLDIDATSGLEAAGAARGVMIVRGDAAMFPGLMAANMPGDERDKLLKTMWSAYPVEVKTVAVTSDDQTGEAKITMTGVAKLSWYAQNGGGMVYVPTGTSLGYRADFKREDGPFKDAPHVVRRYPSASAFRLVVKLPLHGEGFKLTAPDVDREVAGQSFFRHSRIDGDVMTIEVATRALTPEFPAAEATAAAEALSEMANTRVYLTAPRSYRATPGDVAAWKAQEPRTAQEYLNRGGKFGDAGEIALALADFEKALSLDPKSSRAYSSRGSVRMTRNDLAGARGDYERALSLEDRNGQAHLGLGYVAFREGRLADAITAFTRATYDGPGNVRPLVARAEAYWQLGEPDRALSDTDEVLRIDPNNAAVRYTRMQILAARLEYDRALAELDEAVRLAPGDPYYQVYRGALLTRMGRHADAAKAFAASISVKPTITAYLTRATNRPKSDLAARLADVDAAEKLEPASVDVPMSRARVYADSGRFADAIKALDQAAKKTASPEDFGLTRAWVYAKAGQTDAALKEFAAIRTQAVGRPGPLNNLCWTQATLGVALEAALNDCQAALKISPKTAAYLDSEGFVYLRLGRFKESVEAYDAAIEQRPQQAASLYGRGIAKLRMGKATEGEADIAAAQKMSDRVEEEFKGYGVTR